MSRSPLTSRGMLVPMGGVGTPAPPRVAAPLNPMESAYLPPGEPGAATRRNFDVNRIVSAGGNLLGDTLHPSIIPFEQLYRRLPEEGMYSPKLSPSRPFSFEMGAYTVPSRQALLLYDLRPDIYRFSGVDPGDYVPLETRRFGSIMGFDITVDQKHVGQMAFELDPVAIQTSSQQAFASNNMVKPQLNPSQAAVAAYSSFANVAGSGNALQPQRPTRYGALSIPFTIVATSGQTVQTRCVVFRAIPSPIAFIEYDIAGVLVPEYWVQNIFRAITPPQGEFEEQIR